jgi:hypothetical protein
VTLVIEWENAIDVTDDWTAKAMAGLERQLLSVAGRTAARPRVLYLYDETAVKPGTIEQAIAAFAPRLREAADVEIIPTPGLTYYKLKNFGVAQSTTDLTVMVDSDAAPQPGWLENLLKPFSDPGVMVVGGVTVLGFDDMLSKTMALSWIFNLAGEGEKSAGRNTIHVNNCAVRTKFFQANPFPDLEAGFKKACVFWLRSILAAGHRYVRTADATVIHAPHPGYKFLAWRAWTSGRDGDFQGFQTVTRSRLGRTGLAGRHFVKKVAKAWRNIVVKGKAVDLPLWQRPAAMAIALAYYSTTFVAQSSSALTQRFTPLPPPLGIWPERDAPVSARP